MADISNYTATIEKEVTGEGVRTAIINALKAVNEEGADSTDTWHGKKFDAFALKKDHVNNLFLGKAVNLGGENNFSPYNPIPIGEGADKYKAVSSYGIYQVLVGISDILDAINGDNSEE